MTTALICHLPISKTFLSPFSTLKNSFEVKGIGGKIARNVDEDIESDVSKYAGDFGIIQGDIKKISESIQKF